MHTVTIECRNVDSCDEGQTHEYPALTERVGLAVGAQLQLVGSHATFTPNEPISGVVTIIDEEAHQVGVWLRIGDTGYTMVHDLTVWADIDDDIVPVP